MDKSLTRVYNFNPTMYIKPDDVLPNFVPTCSQVVLKKVGYDEDKRPVFNLLIGDGRRQINDLGYVAPVGTPVAYELDSEEIVEPECTHCAAEDGVMGLAEGEEGAEHGGSGCKGECCW